MNSITPVNSFMGVYDFCVVNSFMGVYNFFYSLSPVNSFMGVYDFNDFLTMVGCPYMSMISS